MRPDPLTPPDVDLRDFTFMPIDIVRLFGSDFHARSSDSEWRAGMTLWLKSFHQVPSGSIPDNDIALARLAEYGRDANGWQSVKDGALHGWTLCSDDRWYHKVVCEKALEAWISKLLQRRSGAVGNAKRWNTAPDVEDLDRQLNEAAKALQRLSPNSPTLRKWHPAHSEQPQNPSASDLTEDDQSSRPDRDPMATRSQPDRDPIAEGSQGIGIGIGKVIEGVSRADAREHPPTAVAAEPSKPQQRGRKPSPETSWPDDLAFDEADQSYAAKHGFPGYAGERLFEKFEAKAKAKGWTYRDWHAAFRNFVLNEHPLPPRPNGSQLWRPPDV